MLRDPRTPRYSDYWTLLRRFRNDVRTDVVFPAFFHAQVDCECPACGATIWAGNPVGKYFGAVLCSDCLYKRERDLQGRIVAQRLGIERIKDAFIQDEIDTPEFELLLSYALETEDEDRTRGLGEDPAGHYADPIRLRSGGTVA